MCAADARATVVAITGGIGSGKSTVAELFVARGAGLVDTDAIAHALTAPGGAAIDAIRHAFGDGMIEPDGRMDRARMRACVFADPARRRELEAILHPLIRAQAGAATEAAARVHPYVLVAVPLLAEHAAQWRGRVDRVLVVDCPEPVQLDRVMRRSGLTEAQARAIIGSQATRAQRLALADDTIDNGGAPDALPAQVDVLDARYRAPVHAGRAAPPRP